MLGPMYLAEITPKLAIPLIIETLLRIEMIAEEEIIAEAEMTAVIETLIEEIIIGTTLEIENREMIERVDMIEAIVEINIDPQNSRALEETFTKVTNSPV